MSEAKIDVTAICVKIFKVDPSAIVPTVSARSLAEWDSMAHVALLGELEKVMGKRFTAREAARLQSVQNIIDFLLANGYRQDTQQPLLLIR